MSNSYDEDFEKVEFTQEAILKSVIKIDKKMSKIDENLSNCELNVMNKKNKSDASDLSDIIKYDTASLTNDSCAGTSGFSGGGCFDSNSHHDDGPSSRKHLRFPDYEDYEDDDTLNNFGTVHKTLSMTNRYDPDEESTDTLRNPHSSICCNISIHSQAMGGSAGADNPSTASESGTKGSKAFTNNTTSISSSTISSSDPNNRQQCSLAAAGTSGRNDYNFLVKSISQIENFSTSANHNNNRKSETLNHSASQPDNLSTYFTNDNSNTSSLHTTMEAILNVHRTQQYYTTNADLEPFNNNQKSILTIHPQYRLLVSDTNSPSIIESTIYGNNGHPEQLITQQQNPNDYPVSRPSSTETIQSKLSAMQLNESTVMGTLSSNVSQQTSNEEKLNGDESISKNTDKPSENVKNDLIRELIVEKLGMDECHTNLDYVLINSDISLEEQILATVQHSEDENEEEKNKSLSDILDPFSKKIDQLIQLEELYSKQDDNAYERKSKEAKRHVSFASDTLEYCRIYEDESTNDEFDIETATSNDDHSTTECEETDSVTQCLMGIDSLQNFVKSTSDELNNSHSEYNSTELSVQSMRNYSPLCGVLGSPVLEFKELSVLYTKQDTSLLVTDQNISTDEEDNESVTSKSCTASIKETIDVPSCGFYDSTSPTTTPRSQTISDSIEILTAIPIPLHRIRRWTCIHGLPPVLECLDATEIILIDLDNGALKRDHGVMHSHTNEQILTFKNRMGELLFYGIEHPQFCSTNTCIRHRPFEMNIYDTDGKEVITLSRYTTCIGGCLLPCFYHALTTYCPGQIQMGKIKQDITLCVPSYTVYDNMDRDIFVLRGPFGAYFFGNPLTFYIYDNTQDGYSNCGLITDHWTNEQQYIYKNDIYGVKFPLNFDPKRKVLLLSAAVLLKYIYFSGSFQTLEREFSGGCGDYVVSSSSVSPSTAPPIRTTPTVIVNQPTSDNAIQSIHTMNNEPTSSINEIDIQLKPCLTDSTKKLEPMTTRTSSASKSGKPSVTFDESTITSSTTSNQPKPACQEDGKTLISSIKFSSL